MERVYAFTDEYGNFGWDLNKADVSSVFIVSAVIVKASDLDTLRQQADCLRLKHFQTGEMKSSKIGKDHERRKRILGEFFPLPFSVFSIVFNKEDLSKQHTGLRYKTSFYKFLNNIVHRELRRAFKLLTIVADEMGSNDYIQSFSSYVRENQDVPNLFSEVEFDFQSSSNDVILQVADLFCGTLGHQYDLNKRTDQTPNYQKILDKKLFRVEFYPKNYTDYVLENSAVAEDYDKDIAELCFRLAATYIEKYKDSIDELEINARVIVLQYLLFRFMNNNTRTYIPTRELKKHLEHVGIEKMSDQHFRTRIIAKLRDEGVIIASTNSGYKIPSSQTELFDFINKGTTIIMPMLARLKKCRDLVKLGTLNNVDLFSQSEYSELKKFFDDAPGIE